MPTSTSSRDDPALPRVSWARFAGLASLILVLAMLWGQPDADLRPLVVNHDEPKTALILTAHPDDEVMFFTPTILALIADEWSVHALCLSTGGPSDCYPYLCDAH